MIPHNAVFEFSPSHTRMLYLKMLANYMHTSFAIEQ